MHSIFLSIFIINILLFSLFFWHDFPPAGFYICWGCLVWVPSIYTSPGMYLVNHPVNLGPQVLYKSLFFTFLYLVVSWYAVCFLSILIYKLNLKGLFCPVQIFLQLALSILLAGILCIYINYDCDRQRQEFRRTNGKCSVWGKAPSKVRTIT